MCHADQTARTAAEFAASDACRSGAPATGAPRSHDSGEPDELDAVGTVCAFAHNETIFGEGEPAAACYKVVSGIVRLCRMTADGKRQIVGFRIAGELIGVEWNAIHEMTAEAVRDVVAVRYARTRLERLSREKPAVRERLLDQLRHDLRSTQDHIVMLGRQTATERVASFLLGLLRRAGVRDGATVDMRLGRQDIADYLGLTLETVSRTFSDLTGRGIIASPKRRHVVIRSAAGLRTCLLRAA
jgi:CRP/FNR family nitrogen fixation transcriptional regulator